MELLYGAGIAIVVAVLWRAALWFRDYRRALRIRLEPVPPGAVDVDLNSFPELGQVRVRPREPGLGGVAKVDAGHQEPPLGRPQIEPTLPPRAVARQTPPAPVEAAPVAVATLPEIAPAVEDEVEEAVPVLLTPVAMATSKAVEQQDMFAHETIAPPPFARKEKDRNPANANTESACPQYEKPVEPVRAVRKEPELRPYEEVQEVIALHIVAGAHHFNGEDLLRCILGYGLRFGDMSIFHRHEKPTGQGRILFSMAKAVEPGTFDLEAMTGEEIPGVSFFLSLPGVNSIHAYDIMVDTAKRLATELQGEILDQQQQALTRQLIEHYRERVQEFERRRLMQRPITP